MIVDQAAINAVFDSRRYILNPKASGVGGVGRHRRGQGRKPSQYAEYSFGSTGQGATVEGYRGDCAS